MKDGDKQFDDVPVNGRHQASSETLCGMQI